MISFTLDTTSVNNLETFIGLCSKLDKFAEFALIKINDDKLRIFVESSAKFIEYSVDILNMSVNGNRPSFINLKMSLLNQALIKCSEADSGVSVIVDDRGHVTFNSDSTNIGLTSTDNVSDSEIAELEGKWAAYQQKYFSDGVIKVKFTQDLFNFFSSTERLHQITETSNSIGLEKVNGKIKASYADRLALLYKDIDDDSLISTDSANVHHEVYDIAKQIVCSTKQSDLIITYSADQSFMNVDCSDFGLRLVMSLPDISYDALSDSELECVAPDATNNVEITVNKAKLIEAFAKFENIFVSADYNWKDWKGVNLQCGPDLYQGNQLILFFNTLSAEVKTSLQVSNVTASQEENFVFLMSSSIFNVALNIIPEDEIKISFSNISPELDHGASVKIQSDSVTAYVLKLMTD